MRPPVLSPTVDVDNGRAGAAAGLDERVVVALPIDIDAVPRHFPYLDPRAVGPGRRREEVVRQREAELLRRLDALLLGEGEHRVLLRVGRQDLALIALDVGRTEVAAQGGADGQVPDLVPRRVPVDADDMDLRLAVLVGSEPDGHASQLPR